MKNKRRRASSHRSCDTKSCSAALPSLIQLLRTYIGSILRSILFKRCFVYSLETVRYNITTGNYYRLRGRYIISYTPAI